MKFFTPKQIYEELNKSVIGQHEAKLLLSNVGMMIQQRFYQKYLTFGKQVPMIHKTVTLLAGDSGTGKTTIVRTLAKIINAPLLEINTNTLSAEGWHGENLSDLLKKFIKTKANPEDLAETPEGTVTRTIVFLDEFDKVLIDLHDSNQGAHNRAILNNFLKVVEDCSAMGDFNWILGGSFNIHRQELKEPSKTIGFNKLTEMSEKEFNKEFLIEKGLPEELAGRITGLAELKKLTKVDLINILKLPYGYINQYKQLALQFNMQFEVTEALLDSIADEVLNSSQGARALQDVIYKHFEVQLFNLEFKEDEHKEESYLPTR